MKGTLLADYRQRLADRVYEDFVAERPLAFSHKHVLLWGSQPSRGL